MIFSLMSFEKHFNCFWSYVFILQYYSVFVEFLWFPSFHFGYRPQNENPEITENLYFWVYKFQIHMNLFFDHYFNFLSAKTKINKNELNLINLDGLEALERQSPGIWLGIWVNHFEVDVIWRASQLFFKLHSHNSVLWRFCSISVISDFSYLGIGLKTKTRNHGKSLFLDL